MNNLAIHLGHNATVAIANSEIILGLLSQEKCDNIKNSFVFPHDALHALLKEVGLSISDIDQVLISSKEVFPPRAYEYLFDSKNRIKNENWLIAVGKKLRVGIIGRLAPWPFTKMRNIRLAKLKKEGLDYLEQQLEVLGLSDKPTVFLDHHYCHARAAYHSLCEFDTGSSTDPALIFTLDGSGDGICASVTQVDANGDWKLLAATPTSHSLGGIYSNTTRFLGMKILEHEYKVMGLAPYAKDKYMLETYEKIFKPVIRLNTQNPLIFDASFDTANFYSYLSRTAIGERFDNMAAAVQHLTEELVTEWIRAAIKQTGIRNIYTGGGVFMNVKLNRRIQEMEEIKKVRFMPSCGDESLPIGACYAAASSSGMKTRPLQNLNLGVSFKNDEIKTIIEQNKLDKKYQVTYHHDIEDEIAELLSKREIVARVAGRCEWGARSMGNRAILAHPSHMESFYTINDYIKSRDFWMPFAPSMLDTAAPRYLKNYYPEKTRAPHMITAFEASELGVEHLRAAIHQGDHTLRPQVVEESESPNYYRLIKRFEERTGVGAVLNTSFNLHGYPLVATPKQALLTLEQSGLKILALENYILKKV
jgi:carbamoyltransferase